MALGARAVLTRLGFSAFVMLAASPGGRPGSPGPEESDAVRTAERLYHEGSYAKAREVFQKAEQQSPPGASSRWIRLRLLDTAWRAAAQTESADDTVLRAAREGLEKWVQEDNAPEKRDRVWAEAQESLGDFFWARRDSHDWYSGWRHYQEALGYWAGSTDLELARKKYVDLVWRITDPPNAARDYRYGYYGRIPYEVAQNTLKLARTPLEKANASYLVATSIRHEGGEMKRRQQIPELFETALSQGKRSAWYDDALYEYGQWASSDRYIRGKSGNWESAPDYALALKVYRRLLSEFRKGESAHYDSAKENIDEIVRVDVSLGVPYAFLPDGPIDYSLGWRNVSQVELALYAIDLTRDVKLTDRDKSASQWLDMVPLSGRPVRTWNHPTHDDGGHRPGQAALKLEQGLKPGVYVLEARAQQKRAREVILVSDLTTVLRTSGTRVVAFVCGTIDGVPAANAEVVLQTRVYREGRYVWERQALRTDADGLANFKLATAGSSAELWVGTKVGERQSIAVGSSYGGSSSAEAWKLFAFTDRPTYRPEDTVQWKLIARQRGPTGYQTPAGRPLWYEIYDPRGTKLKEGAIQLNAFGSAWGEVALGSELPLGEYRVNYYSVNPRSSIGSATLFRLEEYKLPEFKVSVRPAEDNGKAKVYRLGDTVEAEVTAEYYFGGPVAQADVEVVVYQRPSPILWFPERRYPWFYNDIDVRPNYGMGGQISRETYKTDARGIAKVKFETQTGIGSNVEYRIEARVRDSSRREVVGGASVKVGQYAYSALLHTEHVLFGPGDPITVALETKDANGKPVSASGEVKVTRERYVEWWVDPAGKRVERPMGKAFPPAPARDDERPWALRSAGYEHEEILTRAVKTGANGEAELRFNAQKDGYYRVHFHARDGLDDIEAETSIFVAAPGTQTIGYRSGGLELIVDADTFRTGQKAPVLISTPTSNRYVLFTVEAEDFIEVKLVHVTGTAKRVELSIDERHVPNVFVTATMVGDRQVFQTAKQVVVPPAEHFLDVQVAPDRPQVRPGEKGTWKVVVKDARGKPVAAELSLAVADEAVYSIQDDYAGDPRPFFFGTKRDHRVQLQSSVWWKPLALREAPADAPVNDLDARRLEGGRDKARNLSQFKDVLGRFEQDEERMNDRVVASEAKNEKPEFAARKKTADAPAASPVQVASPVPGPDQNTAVTVRNDFRATAGWIPNAVSDAQGQATLAVTYPDTLTTWRATARVASSASQFGTASSTTRAELPFLVRLEAPRFFVVNDSVVISALVNNHSNQKLSAKVMLDAEGLEVEGWGSGRSITVDAQGEGRVDWRVSVKKAGAVKLKVTARAAGFADAMEKSFLAHEHGIEKLLVRSGQVPEGGAKAVIELPDARRSTRMTVQLAPSIAVTALDALPYLIDYPYGCTEQTLSRFLPAVLVAKTLKEQGLKPEDVANRMFGGIDPALRAQRPGSQGPQNLAKLDDMVKTGLDRLYDSQHGDGGWGWWKEDRSDRFMTAYTLWGLSLARDAGVSVRSDVLARGASWLEKELVQEEANPDAQVWLLHALVTFQKDMAGQGRFGKVAFDNLWQRRDGMNAYSRALLTLVASATGAKDRAEALVRNLENGVIRDERPDVSPLQPGKTPENDAVLANAHWGKDGIFYRWSDGGVEATAFVLRALLAVNPNHPLIPGVMNWLVKNRRGTQWSNTRDTAIVVLALNDYLKRKGELKADLRYELLVNGRKVVERAVTPKEALNAPASISVDPSWLTSGRNEIEIRKSGKGSLYFSAAAEFFSLEDPLTPAGNEIFVRRQYLRQVPRQTLLKGTMYTWEPLEDEGKLVSGERVEVIVTVQAKNNYSYLVFEDLKPAGLEAVEVKSGESMVAHQLKAGQEATIPRPDMLNDDRRYTQVTQSVHQELRDRKVALFVSNLPEGIWEMRYSLRAEVPGHFHGLPVMGHAMYVPELRANSSETRITVEDSAKQ